MEVEELDLTNKLYDEVDSIVRTLAGIPKEISWDSLATSALRGFIPKENTHKFYEAVQLSYEIHNLEYDFKNHYKYFRNSQIQALFYNPSENYYSYVYKNSRVFLLSSYDNYTHECAIKVFDKLASSFCPCDIKLYSIKKDIHEGSRHRGAPLKRNNLALLIATR
jgi:hypothetical protein